MQIAAFHNRSLVQKRCHKGRHFKSVAYLKNNRFSNVVKIDHSIPSARALPPVSETVPAVQLESHLESIHNFRDLSWVDKRIKPGVIMRCANPCEATQQDVYQLFHEFNIKEMMDLRSRDELLEDSVDSPLISKAGLHQHSRVKLTGQVSSVKVKNLDTDLAIIRHNVSLLNRQYFLWGLLVYIPYPVILKALLSLPSGLEKCREVIVRWFNTGGLGLLYKVILDTARPEICTVMNLTLQSLESGRPVLLFCKAGKDRTGIISALVLATVGCSTQQILSDYERSDSFRKAALAGMEHKPELRGIDLARFEGAPVEAMSEAIAHVKSKYGGLSGYLCSIGFGIDKQAKLRQALTLGIDSLQ